MSNRGAKLVKNASTLLASQGVTWILSLILTVALPRYLGAEASGELGVAGAIWSILGVILVFGMDTYLVKEIARSPDQISNLLSTSLITRALLFIASCAAILVYINLRQYSPEMVALIYVVGISQLSWRFVSAAEAALQGTESINYIAIANVVGKIINTGLGLGVVFFRLDIFAAALAGGLAGLATLVIEIYFLVRNGQLRFHFGWRHAMLMLGASSPYLLSAFGQGLYKQVDVLIIETLLDTQAVGWYRSAYQLFAASFFLPVIFITVLFPTLSRTHTHDPQALPRMLRKSFDLMLLLSVPIGLGLLVIGGPLMILLFGPDFAGSGPILSALGIVLILTYQNILVGKFLIATDRQRFWASVMLIAALATVPLDFLFIPWCQRLFGQGGVGGAISFTITELAMLIGGIRMLPEGSLGRSNAWTAARIFAAGLAMVAAIWWCREMFIAIPIVIGGLTYLSLIALLRVVPREDLALFTDMLRRASGRLRQRKAESVSIRGA